MHYRYSCMYFVIGVLFIIFFLISLILFSSRNFWFSFCRWVYKKMYVSFMIWQNFYLAKKLFLKLLLITSLSMGKPVFLIRNPQNLQNSSSWFNKYTYQIWEWTETSLAAIDEVFGYWDPSTTTPIKGCRPLGGQCWKINLICSYENVFVSLWTFQPTLI